MEENLIFKNECYQIVGCCMNVHNKLGKGFKEVVYKDALEIELKEKQIIYEREKPFNITYNGIILAHKFISGFFIFETIILELKAAFQIHPDNFRQTLNYLKASQVKLGIIINFGEDQLKFQRVICTY